jgi:hypothetical protein
VNDPVPLNGTACDDGNPCTAADTCAGGVCAGITLLMPGEVTNVTFDADKATLTWDTAAGAGPGTVHDVPRGLVTELAVGAGGSETCLASGVSAATATDGSNPPSGDAYWYLVRGRNACNTGTYGFAGQNGVPTTERVTASCP